ncbi:hypothetical protein MRX96_049603 [Rhipicephalus microplus]
MFSASSSCGWLPSRKFFCVPADAFPSCLQDLSLLLEVVRDGLLGNGKFPSNFRLSNGWRRSHFSTPRNTQESENTENKTNQAYPQKQLTDTTDTPDTNAKPRQTPQRTDSRLGSRASRVGAQCALRRTLQRASQRSELGKGARFAETTTINSDSPDQLDCMDADDFEPTDSVGPSDSTPGLSGVAEASNNTYLRPTVPHTPWFRVIDARRKKVVAEEASATPPAAFH